MQFKDRDEIQPPLKNARLITSVTDAVSMYKQYVCSYG